MNSLSVPLRGMCLALAACGALPLQAQEPAVAPANVPQVAAGESEGQTETDTPTAETDAPPAPAAAASGGIDPVTVPLPDLAFEPDEEDVRNYDKYFYFHRADTDFETAYADLQECDAHARGFTYYAGTTVPIYQFGVLGGALGGAIGSVMADAIWGSAERRRMRRVNMRVCMGFKGYRTYGLPKDLWQQFNFDEGLTQVEERRRQRLLQIQARVASGPTPEVGEMVK